MLLVIGSNLYDLKQKKLDSELHLKSNKKIKSKRSFKKPTTFSIIIPAFNEAKIINKTLNSLLELNYNIKNFEVIVVNDGSTDNTQSIIQEFVFRNIKKINIKLINQKNSGKASALNTGIKSTTFGKVVVCIDADSQPDVNFLKNMDLHFQDENVVCLASHVKITKTKGILNFVQRLEYLVSYEMKKAESFYNINYIVGGIGSAYRRSQLSSVGLYESNTMTEDIDLSLKMIRLIGNKNNKFIYANDCTLSTGHVPNFKQLVRQRFRWKYGRLQTFYKNKSIFFSNDAKHNKWLTKFTLPFTIIQELQFIFEPLVYLVIISTAIIIQDYSGLIGAIAFFIIYNSINIFNAKNQRFKDKFIFFISLPLLFVFTQVLNLAEYLASLKSLLKLTKLTGSLKNHATTWISPDRA